jgi:diguanylate cyclase (GGDEF)-like protein
VIASTQLRSQHWLYLSIGLVLGLAAAVSAISSTDPEGVWARIAVILLTVGVAMWLPWPSLLMMVPAIWLVPNFMRGIVSDEAYWTSATALELPGLLALAAATVLGRFNLRYLEEENAALSEAVDQLADIDPETGVYQEKGLIDAIEAELVRSRRFGRSFALVLAGVSDLSQRFDYREAADWQAGFKSSATILRSTRARIDRVYRHGDRGFALILPETGQREVAGLVRRLIRTAKRATPAESEPGGPLAMHFGVTFFPQCATTVDDLLRRADIVMRLAERSPTRLGMDSAEAPEMPPPETLRRPEPLPIPVAAADPLLALTAAGDGGAAAAVPPVGEAVAELLGHLNETLELIKQMRSSSAA